MKRRVVCVWLPHLAAERILKHAADRDRPFAVVAEARSALRLCSLNTVAREAGLSPGMALADARAILPDLATAERDAERDGSFLRALGRWAQRFTPSVALEASEGADGTLMLDTSGCSHLFGGEEPMLAEIESGLARFGLTVRMAIADTRGAAWALARYGAICIAPPGQTRVALDPLPVAALGFEAEACAQLHRLGLRTAGEVARLPRASLAKRFGVETVRRIDRAFGAEAEPMTPMAQTAPYAVRLSLPEPIGTTDRVAEALARLLARLCERLERERQGARRLRLTARQADGGRDACEIGLMRPSRDADGMAPLFARGIASLDADFGIDMLRLEAVQVEPCAPAQVSIDGPSGEDALDALLARLGNRLGFEALERLAPAESHIPERSWLRFAAAHADRGMVGEGAWPCPHAPRPITMVPPEPLRIETPSHPRHPPNRFLWRGTLFEMTNAIGPERIAPEWWLDDPAWQTGARDYWRVQAVQPATACARRLWLFHTPQVPHDRPGQDRWFVQGLFA